MPSAIQAMSRRYEFWKTPENLQKAADRMSGKATWQLYAHEADSARPHELSHGHTDDQLECRLPWQSPPSIGLCGSSWYLWCCGSSEWTFAAGPPGFFPSPGCRASAVERDITFAPVPSDSSEQSQVPWSIQGPASVADSSPVSQVPEVEIPQVDVECFLSARRYTQSVQVRAPSCRSQC